MPNLDWTYDQNGEIVSRVGRGREQRHSEQLTTPRYMDWYTRLCSPPV